MKFWDTLGLTIGLLAGAVVVSAGATLAPSAALAHPIEPQHFYSIEEEIEEDLKEPTIDELVAFISTMMSVDALHCLYQGLSEKMRKEERILNAFAAREIALIQGNKAPK